MVKIIVDEDQGPNSLRARTGQALITELRRAGVAAEVAPAVQASGAKSGATASLGALVVGGLLSGTTITALATIVVAFIQRGSARTVTLVRGEHRIVLRGASKEDQRAALESFLRDTHEMAGKGDANEPGEQGEG